MFFALAERRRRIEQAREEGREEARRETGEMLMVLTWPQGSTPT
jgi:hypothetical protein